MPVVSCLSIAPVKSLALLHPEEVTLEACGVAENRRFYLIDEGGRLLNGLRQGPLVQVVPDYDTEAERLALRFPDGSVAAGTISLGEAVETDWTGRFVKGHVVEGPWARPLSAYAGRPVRLVRSDVPGAACSVHGVSLISDASVEELARRSGREALDARRFRMLVAVAGCRPHEEDSWIGRRVKLGDALVRVLVQTGRCATTTRDPSTGLRDFDTLRAIKAYRGLRDGRSADLGVYAEVEQPGRVRVGDGVMPA